MNLLFVHQNYPGQYRELLPRIARSGKHRIIFLTQRKALPKPTDHKIVVYEPFYTPPEDAFIYTRMFEGHVGAGVGAARACSNLKQRGFKPDLVLGHTGWGELLFIKEVWAEVPVVGCFEYYFIPKGGPIEFDPEFPPRSDISALLLTRNANAHLSHLRCDGRHSATHWQRNAFPEILRSSIEVLHEGVRTDLLQPDHDSPLDVEIGGTRFERGEEIVTYVARNLEPMRGFHIFMRTLPLLLSRRPQLRIAIVGGDNVSYGRRLPEGETFRGMLKQELGDRIDWSRVHFLGQIPYPSLTSLLRLSHCHVYLTVPFVPSWSMLEAMALEKTVVASDVAPVRELIRHGETGFLVDFFDKEGLAERILDVVGHPDHYREIGRAARRDVVERFDFATVSMPAFLGYLDRFVPGAARLAG